MTETVLVGDVGGTHVRFAVAAFDGQWHLTHKQDIESGTASFQSLLRNYLDFCGVNPPSAISLAVAGPVNRGAVIFTNRNWRLSEAELNASGFAPAVLSNDFAALALAARHLTPAQLFTLGPDLRGEADAPIAVMGAGTGFGSSCLIRHGHHDLPLACEAGHIGFAPGDETEDAVVQSLRGRFGRVSVERILSGPGLENLLSALREVEGMRGDNPSAAEIMDRAKAGDVICRKSAALFCGIYGSVAGDIALAQGARGGVYLAGGIAPKMMSILAESRFRQRFEDKGRLSYYLKTIPTRIVTDPDATLIGAAMALRDCKTASTRG